MGNSQSPSFWMGSTSPIFHLFGKTLVSKEVFMRVVTAGRIAGKLSLITLIGILSYPGDSTSFSFTGLNENYFSMGYVLGSKVI